MPRQRRPESIEKTATKQVAAKKAPAKKKPPKSKAVEITGAPTFLGAKKLTAAQKVIRDRALVHDRITFDLTWESLALKYGIDERTCRRIAIDYRDINQLGLSEIEQKAEIWELLASLDGQMERLRDLRERAKAQKNMAAELGAEKALLEVRIKRTEILQQAGALPKHLGRMRLEIDASILISTVVKVLGQVVEGEVPPGEARRRVLELLPGERTG